MSKCITQHCSFHDIYAFYSCNRNVADDRPISESCPNYTTMKGGKMKRYKIVDAEFIRPHPQPWDVEDYIIEDPNGAWVRWEDVQKEMDELYKTAYFTGQNNAKLAEGFSKSICTCDMPFCSCGAGIVQLKEGVKVEVQNLECNCEEMSQCGNVIRTWVCPAHGYKRR